ncbi:MAG: M20/M25/M40 family metallo-hydrolase [Hydrotalea flava]|uniref:M20/M25/M40 family metallo-hydrolase n=1 Tax=Hydrotalea TaxID=1004300 RepID=UPI001027FE4D|nr:MULTISPECIES: M20/M25/M40 family metallo-hydrolase [Hydrotalea]NIM35831.1 M20/M25/M40 family metallo-hydrolase [Hydrotalea flava]NIM38683.1 M20/M25/M40 family metallo-hydrolase [Hydrotalea flava]NIN03871.1 M20/M25/M40 family metallo-hydrolase [Hydrotalea flava]NIN15592.1 M20/M25/M40 family metallo-hydrolase [Hydrotalea flava]NIO94609.1 M20/M25/M40 family metallo-hydrolase [Hydrotalea flava]
MKYNWIKILMASFLVLLITLILHTVFQKPWPAQKAKALLPLPDSAIVHMSRAVQIPTISPEDTLHIDTLHFTQFNQFLTNAYPLIHQQLKRTVVNGYSYVYQWDGTDKTLAPIILMGHYDVVPVEQASVTMWQHPPFSGVVADSAIWGRGSVDDKSGVVSILETVEQLLKEGYQPKRTVLLCFGHNEESTGTGAIAIVDTLQKRGIRADLVIDEGGEISTEKIKDIPRPIAFIGVAEKGYATFQLKVSIPGGHSSKPARETAIDVLSRALYKLRSTQMPATITEPVATFLDRAGASSTNFFNKVLLTNQWLFAWADKRVLSASPESNAMIRTTIVPTILESGVRENVIPTIATAIVNSRILSGETTHDVIQFMKNTIQDERVHITVTGDFNTEPSAATDTHGPAFLAVQQAITDVVDDVIPVPFIMIGATDSRSYRKISNGVVNFSALMDSKGFHGLNERLPIADYRRYYNFYRTVIETSAGLVH